MKNRNRYKAKICRFLRQHWCPDALYPRLSISTQAKIHKTWPINKCHFLDGGTPWERKQKFFFLAEGCLSVVGRPADSIQRRGGVALSAACVCISLNVCGLKAKQHTAVRNKAFPSCALNPSGSLPQHASNGRSVRLEAFCTGIFSWERHDLDNDVDRWKVFSQGVITPDYLFSQFSKRISIVMKLFSFPQMSVCLGGKIPVWAFIQRCMNASQQRIRCVSNAVGINCMHIDSRESVSPIRARFSFTCRMVVSSHRYLSAAVGMSNIPANIKRRKIDRRIWRINDWIADEIHTNLLL